MALAVTSVKNDLTVAVYPNPSAGKFYFNWASDESADIAIYTTDGRLLAKKQNALTGHAIDLGKPGSGLYIAEVKTKTGVQQVKLLVH